MPGGGIYLAARGLVSPIPPPVSPFGPVAWHDGRMRRLALLVLMAVTVVACGGGGTGAGPEGPPLPPLDLDRFVADLRASDTPTIVNLWASWCVPCRSEAPLFREAHAAYGDRIRFVGVATEDVDAESRAFLVEFGLTFDNLSDPEGLVKQWAGAFGLPTTIFVRPGGEILRTHFGVIDDQTLALGIDDLLAG